MINGSTPFTNPPGNMPGFDPEFSDIVDYILRITYRIWEGKQPGLCERYYSKDCPVYTLAGYSEGAEQIIQNTLLTMEAFPDRTLHADNIIWSGNPEEGFHTSHLITTTMTHLGASEHGPATGRSATIQVIAHCVVRENRIVEEWLVRDNWSLAEQLGYDPQELAAELARKPWDAKSHFARWLDSEWKRVQGADRIAVDALPDDAVSRIHAMINNIWNGRIMGDCRSLYADNACIHASARPDIEGIDAIEQFFIQLVGAMPDVQVSIDHTCTNSMLSGDYVAVRWTLAGTHKGGTFLGPASDAPIVIIGESQYHIEDGKIVREWIVFDQLGVLTQIERVRQAS